MTDLDEPIFSLDDIHAFAAAATARETERAGKTRTAAGRALVLASRIVEQDGAVITVSDGDVLDAILAIESEAGIDVATLARTLHLASPEAHQRHKCRDRHDLRAARSAAIYARLRLRSAPDKEPA